MKISKKYDKELIDTLLKTITLDKDTGHIKSNDLYISHYVNICWKGTVVSVPIAHLIWLLTYGKWPSEGKVIDHVNDDALDNRPINLQEITHEENNYKRRGRKVSRNFGKTKYGHGIYINLDKRDGRYYVTHTPSRGQTGENKTIKLSIGGADTLQGAEQIVKDYIEELLRPVDLDDLLKG